MPAARGAATASVGPCWETEAYERSMSRLSVSSACWRSLCCASSTSACAISCSSRLLSRFSLDKAMTRALEPLAIGFPAMARNSRFGTSRARTLTTSKESREFQLMSRCRMAGRLLRAFTFCIKLKDKSKCVSVEQEGKQPTLSKALKDSNSVSKLARGCNTDGSKRLMPRPWRFSTWRAASTEGSGLAMRRLSGATRAAESSFSMEGKCCDSGFDPALDSAPATPVAAMSGSPAAVPAVAPSLAKKA
mmetsp:Transcript_130342/g.278531  ORF Transcript_130342/g.278531 Transcript_130342/m.278531 type:complete len:248 (-) Transcript_130342:251-994(-)